MLQNTATHAKFNIYSSSAGSGKTFTLTKEYLKLALKTDQDYYFKRILAITFTNDAANEMKERILAALQDFSSENFDESSKFWTMAEKILEEEPTLNLELLQQRAEAVFYRILQEYSDFAVRTIDSFVNQLVTAFSEDLGLPYNYEIVLDKDTVLIEAVEKLIEKAGMEEHEDISKVLEDFALSKAEDGKSWNRLPEELAEFGANQLNDLFYPAISKLNDLEVADFRKIQFQLLNFQENLEENVKNLARNFTEIIENQGITIEDFKLGGRGGIGKYFYEFEDNFEKRFNDEPNSTQLKAIENDEWYTKTQTTFIKEKIDGIAENLRAIFNDIQALRERDLPKYQLYKNILPNFYKLSLLSKIKAEFEEVLRDKNQVFISEFNRRILQVVLAEPVPFIYERIGEKFNHLLIDEFQDTSEMQFYNLLPLIENSLAKNHFNLLVGDAKQSIYRWRGGKMELIVQLYKKKFSSLINNELISDFQLDQFASIEPYISPVSLNTNYRSTKEVIDFNNDFFEKITENEKQNFPYLPEVYDQDFQQKSPANAKTGGHVAFSFVEKEEGNLPMLDKIKILLETAILEGYQPRDIAILTRSNKSSSETANFLKELGYEIISRDSLLLKNSGAIRLIVAFLRVLNQPDNQLAKYEAVYLFHQQILHKNTGELDFDNGTINHHELTNDIADAVESHDIELFYNYFGKKGYHFQPFALQRVAMYEMAEKIIGILGLFEKSNEQEYLFRFLDIVLDFGLRKNNHLQDFLKYWEEKKNSLSVKSSGSKNAITITTIHRSKGLEYPVVLIPYANWDIQPRWQNVFWGDLQHSDYEELTKINSTLKLNSSPFNFTGNLEKTILAEQYTQEKQSYFLENLNMLYVAFTRAVDKLFVVAEKPVLVKKTGLFKGKGVSQLLLDYLGEKYQEEIDNYVIFQGRPNERITKITELENVIELTKIITEDRSDKLRLRRISDKVFDESLNKNNDQTNKIRTAFDFIKSKNDLDEAIRQLIGEGIIKRSETVEMKEQLKKVMALPQLSPLFETNLEVITEKEILTPDGKMQRPDRVIVRDNKTYIIDFKTTAKAEIHHTKIRQFGHLYHQMGYKNITLMLVYLASLEVVKID